MNRNFKLGLAGLGFLGANGALVPVLNGNLSFPTPSFTDLGGGILYKTDLSKKEYESPKLNLSAKRGAETSLDLDTLKVDVSSPKLDLKSQEEDSLKLNSESVVSQNNAQLSSTISGIYTEIGREGRVSDINQQLERKYSTLLTRQFRDKPQEHVKNFEEVKRQITGQSRSGRGKRDISETILTQVQRDSIHRMFHLYHGLKEESKKLSEELEVEFFNGLNNLLVAETPSPLKQTRHSPEDIKKALAKINWTGSSIRTQKNRGARNARSVDLQSWGAWSENPFQYFYSSEKEFQEDIQQLQSSSSGVSSAKQEQAQIQSSIRRIWAGSPLLQKLNGQLSAINQRIAKLEASKDSHIVNKIAKVLLESMGQSFS